MKLTKIEDLFQINAPPNRSWIKYLLLTFLFTSYYVQGQQVLDYMGVTAEPSIVGETQASLFVQTTIKSTIPQNGIITITLPSETKMQVGSLSCSISGDITFSSVSCNANTTQLIRVIVPSQIQAGFTYQINVLTGFTTPASSAETGSFQFRSFLADGVTPLDLLVSGATLTVFPDTFTGATIRQTGSSVVAQTTRIEVAFTTGNVIAAGGMIQLTFPKWNPDAPTSQQLAMVSNPTSVQCTGVQNIAATVSCTFDSVLDTLTIRNAFPSQITANTTIRFQVDTVRNPLSFAPTTIQISTTNPTGTGIIERGNATITANVTANILSSSCIASADDSTVQEYSNFRFEFINPIPINAGTIITIVFPQQFTFDAKLAVVQGYGLFGSLRNLKFTVDESQSSVKILNAFDAYKQANIIGKLVFQQIKNPFKVMQTQDFSVTLNDANGFQVASTSGNITYIPSKGNVNNTAVSVDNSVVLERSNLYVQFKPLHSLTKSSFIHVKLPSFLSVSCNNVQVSLPLVQTSVTCTESPDNYFVFGNPFGNNNYTGGTPLTIKFTDFQNPPSVQAITGITIQTFQNEFVNGSFQNFTVDLYESSTQILYTMTPGQFISQKLETNTTFTYSELSINITLVTQHPIPSNGAIKVVMPQEVGILSTTQGVNCIALSTLTSSITCQIQGNDTILVKSAMPSQGITANQTIKFSMSGLRSPRTTKMSSSFMIYTTDSDYRTIDQVIQYQVVTMVKGKYIDRITVQSELNTVGENSTMAITFFPTVPLYTNNVIYVTIPDDIVGVPQKNKVTCTGGDALSGTQLCNIDGQTVSGQLQIRNNLADVGQAVTYRFRYVQNPLSTKPTSEFKIMIKDAENYFISESIPNSGAVLTVGNPAQMISGNITAGDNSQQALTTITVSVVNRNPIPAGGYLMVRFNRYDYVFNDPANTKCTSLYYQGVTCTFDKSDSFIVRNMFTRELKAGSLIQFTINNVFLNIVEKGTTDSWKVFSYTPDGYGIDRIQNGLALTFGCNSPCATCSNVNPSFCLSCNQITGNIILYKGRCMDKCPDGFYADENLQCQPCDSRCRTCSFDNPLICTSCNPNSLYPFLDGSMCIDSCAFGTYQNQATAKCESCAKPCKSCSGSAFNCQSCDESQTEKYFYPAKNQCLDACPDGWTVPADSADQICQQCSPQCKTCSGKLDMCTSCNDPLKLSLFDGKCVTECPVGKTIWDPAKRVCDVCDPKCNTCSKSKDFCTSCANNLYLQESSGKCVGECSTDNKLVGYNGVCTKCASTCLTCVNKPDSCLTCAKGKFLFDFTCVEKCPSGYEVSEKGQCVISGLRCPFGQEVNPQGNGCVLVAQVCQFGFRLNVAKDKCIPGPGHYAPFPLIIACAFFSIIVFASWIKYRDTIICSNLIAIISFIETIGLIAQVILAYDMGVYSTFALTLVAILFLYGSNMFFAIIFFKQVHHDSAFKYWTLSYKITSTTVMLIGALINFKCFRFLYGRLFDKNHFHAAFDEPEVFFRPFTFISVFSILTTMLPILVANIIGLVFIEYGYQVNMFCIELSIIEGVLLLLMIYEKCKLKSIVMKQQNMYYKVEPKLLDNSQIQVMSSLQDQEYSNYSAMTMLTAAAIGPKSKTNPLFKEYYERRRQLEQLISTLVSQKATKGKDESTVEEIARLHEEELLRVQMRNCRSYRDIREIDEDFGPNYDGDDCQNFISAPVSPREKELIRNPFFTGNVIEFKRAVNLRNDFYDNCYAEAKPAHYFPMRDCKLITVKTQTNILELLAIDDLPQTKFRSRFHLPTRHLQQDISDEEYVEENLQQDYTHQLISEVIEGMKDEQYKKTRRRLPKNRLMQIPNFDLGDIMGDFEIDENGNNLIVKGKDGKLNDREGRRVNKRGYLIDQYGNVITQRGIQIFKRDEIDSDDEIPAPFCFEKKKEALFKVEELKKYNQKMQKKKMGERAANLVNGDLDDIEAEYRKIRERNKSNRSSVESLIGETPAKYNKKNKPNMKGIDDSFLNKIVQPIQAKSKNQLLGNAGGAGSTIQSRQVQNQSSLSAKDVPNGSTHQRAQSDFQTTIDQANIDNTLQTSINSGIPGRPTSNRPQGMNFPAISRNMIPPEGLQFTNNLMTTDDRLTKIRMLKSTLGSKKEDQVLRKQLDKYETQLTLKSNLVNDARRKTNLAQRALAKVYGKVQGKFEDIDFHKRMNSSINMESGEEDRSARQMKRYKGPIQPNSRMKDLEQIYLKQRPVSTSVSMQRQPKAPEGAFMSDSSPRAIATANKPLGGTRNNMNMQSFMETGIDSASDMAEEARLKKELDKMKAILDMDSKLKQQQQATKKKKEAAKSKPPMAKNNSSLNRGGGLGNTRSLIDGGWV